MYALGIDIGTGSSRALLVAESGEVRAACSAAHEEIRMLQPFWAEQRPENWWDAAQEAIRRVLRESGIDASEVRSIGLSGQMHGVVLLDASGKVLRPALIWCDQRSQPQVDWVNQTVGVENVLAHIANPVVTGWTLPKLLWVRDHEPALFAQARHLLLPKDYVRFRLTGEYATEVSDASGTALFDVQNRKWSTAMINALGLDAGMLPEARESSEISGRLGTEVAEQLGLPAGIPVVGGGSDQAASGIGSGIVEPGIASCTLGTSGVVFAHTEQPEYDAKGRVHTFCHAVPGKWHVMGVTQSAGLSLQWMRNRLAPGDSYDDLMREAGTAERGSQGLFWLPYLMGERTPHLDARARAGWIGLTASHTRAHLIRSVIEGVCYSQKDGLQIIEGMGIEVKSVRISGGGARSAFWRQVLADVLNKPVVRLANDEGSAYGAALLALVGAGAFGSVREACAATIRETDMIEPGAAAELYAADHKVYQSAYPALKPVYDSLR